MVLFAIEITLHDVRMHVELSNPSINIEFGLIFSFDFSMYHSILNFDSNLVLDQCNAYSPPKSISVSNKSQICFFSCSSGVLKRNMKKYSLLLTVLAGENDENIISSSKLNWNEIFFDYISNLDENNMIPPAVTLEDCVMYSDKNIVATVKVELKLTHFSEHILPRNLPRFMTTPSSNSISNELYNHNDENCNIITGYSLKRSKSVSALYSVAEAITNPLTLRDETNLRNKDKIGISINNDPGERKILHSHKINKSVQNVDFEQIVSLLRHLTGDSNDQFTQINYIQNCSVESGLVVDTLKKYDTNILSNLQGNQKLYLMKNEDISEGSLCSMASLNCEMFSQVEQVIKVSNIDDPLSSTTLSSLQTDRLYTKFGENYNRTVSVQFNSNSFKKTEDKSTESNIGELKNINPTKPNSWWNSLSLSACKFHLNSGNEYKNMQFDEISRKPVSYSEPKQAITNILSNVIIPRSISEEFFYFHEGIENRSKQYYNSNFWSELPLDDYSESINLEIPGKYGFSSNPEGFPGFDDDGRLKKNIRKNAFSFFKGKVPDINASSEHQKSSNEELQNNTYFFSTSCNKEKSEKGSGSSQSIAATIKSDSADLWIAEHEAQLKRCPTWKPATLNTRVYTVKIKKNKGKKKNSTVKRNKALTKNRSQNILPDNFPPALRIMRHGGKLSVLNISNSKTDNCETPQYHCGCPLKYRIITNNDTSLSTLQLPSLQENVNKSDLESAYHSPSFIMDLSPPPTVCQHKIAKPKTLKKDKTNCCNFQSKKVKKNVISSNNQPLKINQSSTKLKSTGFPVLAKNNSTSIQKKRDINKILSQSYYVKSEAIPKKEESISENKLKLPLQTNHNIYSNNHLHNRNKALVIQENANSSKNRIVGHVKLNSNGGFSIAQYHTNNKTLGKEEVDSNSDKINYGAISEADYKQLKNHSYLFALRNTEKKSKYKTSSMKCLHRNTNICDTSNINKPRPPEEYKCGNLNLVSENTNNFKILKRDRNAMPIIMLGDNGCVSFHTNRDKQRHSSKINGKIKYINNANNSEGSSHIIIDDNCWINPTNVNIKKVISETELIKKHATQNDKKYKFGSEIFSCPYELTYSKVESKNMYLNDLLQKRNTGDLFESLLRNVSKEVNTEKLLKSCLKWKVSKGEKCTRRMMIGHKSNSIDEVTRDTIWKTVFGRAQAFEKVLIEKKAKPLLSRSSSRRSNLYSDFSSLDSISEENFHKI